MYLDTWIFHKSLIDNGENALTVIATTRLVIFNNKTTTSSTTAANKNKCLVPVDMFTESQRIKGL
jgi:hypothetical protein